MAPTDGGPGVDGTMGALFLGVILSMACWGAESVQVYNYFNRFSSDSWKIRSLVVWVCTLDTTHQALGIASMYAYLVTHYGDRAFLGKSLPLLNWIVMVNALITLSVQGFFLSRIYRLSKIKLIVLAVLGPLVLSQFCTATVYFGKTYNIKTLAERNKLYGFVIANTLLTASADIGVAGTLIYLLQRSRTGFKRNEKMIQRLTIFTMNTTVATALCGILGAITAIALRKTLVYLAFYRLGGRLYTNSLLATLNARTGGKGGGLMDDQEVISGVVNDVLPQLSARSDRQRAQSFTKSFDSQPQVLNIRVERETIRDHDPLDMHKVSAGEIGHSDDIAFQVKSDS